MRKPWWQKLMCGVALLAFAVTAVACGDDDDSTSSSSETDATDAPAAEEPGAFAAANYTTDLTDVCPETIRAQTGWLAEPELGVFYQLIGGGGEMSQYTYSGPLGSTGVNLEVYDGGPGLGDGQYVPSALYTGNLIQGETPDLGLYGDGDAIANSAEFPATSVFNIFDKDPQNLVFDPETYDITDLDSLIAATEDGAKIYVFSTDLAYVQYLIGQGVPADAFIGGFAGDYDRFISEGGALIQQGISTDTNFRLEEELPEWGKPVEDVYVHDLGYDTYSINVYVADNRMEELSPCLEKLVPLMQQAVVDYMASPDEINQMIATYNEEGYGAPFWTASVEHNTFSHDLMASDELVANGTDDTLGNAEGERLQELIDILVPILESQGVEVDPDLTPEDLFTDEYLDPSIGLP